MFGMSNGAPPDKRKTKPAAEQKTAASARPKDAAGDAIEVSVLLTPAQADKLHRLGGSPWILAQIDNAKAPKRD